jgi:hypothetical protein
MVITNDILTLKETGISVKACDVLESMGMDISNSF